MSTPSAKPRSPRRSPAGKRLVVVSYHFGPSGPVGGLRWWGLAKYLARLGWDIHVVSAAHPDEPGTGTPLPEGVVLHHQPPGRTLEDRYRDTRIRMSTDHLLGGDPTRDSASPGVSENDPLEDTCPPPPTGLAAVRGELGALASFPDEARGWVMKAARETRRVVRRLDPDAVVSSGPPHSAHLSTWIALRGLSTRWLMDLRDPWSVDDRTHPNIPEPLKRSWLLRRAVDWMEERTMGASAGFVVTTPELAYVLGRRYPGTVPYCLTNGVDPEGFPRRTDRYPGFSLAHVGTLYARRDPRPLLRAFRRQLDADPRMLADGSKVRFAGAVEAPYRRMLDLSIAELHLEPHVEVMGLVPRHRALEILARSSAAVVLTGEQDLQIPGKLYEPVAMGVPTLVLASEGGATGEAARRLGLPRSAPHDVDAIDRALTGLRTSGVEEVPGAVVDSIHYKTLACDAEKILLHDPFREPMPSFSAWTQL